MEPIVDQASSTSDDLVLRVSIEMSARQIQCLDALRENWGLASRSAVIHRLLDQVLTATKFDPR